MVGEHVFIGYAGVTNLVNEHENLVKYLMKI